MGEAYYALMQLRRATERGRCRVIIVSSPHLCPLLDTQYYVPVDDAAAAMAATNVTSIYMPLLGVLENPLGPVALSLLGYSDPMKLFTNRSASDVIFGWANDTLLSEIPLAGIPTHYPGLQQNDSDAAYALNTHGINRIYTGKLTSNLAREFQSE